LSDLTSGTFFTLGGRRILVKVSGNLRPIHKCVGKYEGGLEKILRNFNLIRRRTRRVFGAYETRIIIVKTAGTD
jgi:hypothetical protein